ncbi:MAG: peptidoglycan recognition family protein [Parafilimonas sp.]
MPNWKGIVGRNFTPIEFDGYCHELQWTAWRPSFIVVHNTAVPSLSQRPNGFTKQQINNLEVFYRDTQKWKAGPHLFVDDKQIWVFTPLTVSGTHSPSWNKVAWGIEMLGNYEKEAFDSGRGLQVRENTVAAMATLYAILGIDPSTTKIHREDPLTTHACPGKNVRKLEIIQEVQDLMISRHAGEHPIKPVP